MKPEWIRGKISLDENSSKVRTILRELGINTVCEEAACPNKGECWEKKHVTFMILGNRCTRDCVFCNVTKEAPSAPDPLEPAKIAEAVKKLGVKYAVITSVTRDDLSDKGAGQFVRTVKEISSSCPDVPVELLIPDLGADVKLLEKISSSGARVIGHNMEMPRRLYREIRPKADYDRSLEVLKILKNNTSHGSRATSHEVKVKSSIMLGLGEAEEDILDTLLDLKKAEVDIVYMGQYLSPSGRHWPVKKYYTPEEFDHFARKAGDLGFGSVCAGPMVRSSYRAALFTH